MGPMNFRSGLLLYEEHLYSWLVIFWLSNHKYSTFDQKKKLTHPLRIHLYPNILCGDLLQENKQHRCTCSLKKSRTQTHCLLFSQQQFSFDQVYPLTLRAAVLALRFSCFCCRTVTSRICFSSSFTLCFQPSLDACSSSTFC